MPLPPARQVTLRFQGALRQCLALWVEDELALRAGLEPKQVE